VKVVVRKRALGGGWFALLFTTRGERVASCPHAHRTPEAARRCGRALLWRITREGGSHA